jgi:hypothetical protein
MGFSTELHSQPLNFLKPSVFQKDIETFLEHTELPMYTTQFVKPSSEQFLRNKMAFWWERPSHFRTYYLILNDNFKIASVFVNPKDPKKAMTGRLPLLRTNIRKNGPFVLECMLDTFERIIWVLDVLNVKGENVFQKMEFPERYLLAQKIVKTCIQPHAVLQSCEVKIVPWKSLEHFAQFKTTPKCSVEFIGLEGGLRRFIWSPPVKADEIQRSDCIIQDVDSATIPQKSCEPQEPQETQPKEIIKTHIFAKCMKDPKALGPDLYILKVDGKDIGSAAIRSMQIRAELRKSSNVKKEFDVAIQWYEPFGKYEIKNVV